MAFVFVCSVQAVDVVCRCDSIDSGDAGGGAGVCWDCHIEARPHIWDLSSAAVCSNKTGTGSQEESLWSHFGREKIEMMFRVYRDLGSKGGVSSFYACSLLGYWLAKFHQSLKFRAVVIEGKIYACSQLD